MIRRGAALFACLALLAPPAWANRLQAGKVGQLVAAALAAAGHGGHALISNHRSYPPCQHAPRVAPLAGSWHAVRLTCDAPQRWARVVRIADGPAPKARVGAAVPAPPKGQPTVVLAENLARGTVLQPAHLRLAERASTPAAGGFAAPELVLGRVLQANLAAGTALQARHLQPEWQVRRGQPVLLETRAGGILIQTAAMALTDAQLGAQVVVQNPSSGVQMRAVVTGPNKVAVRPNISARLDVSNPE